MYQIIRRCGLSGWSFGGRQWSHIRAGGQYNLCVPVLVGGRDGSPCSSFRNSYNKETTQDKINVLRCSRSNICFNVGAVASMGAGAVLFFRRGRFFLLFWSSIFYFLLCLLGTKIIKKCVFCKTKRLILLAFSHLYF